MKKKILAILILMALQLTACSMEQTCKDSDCDETEIYKEGYCKYHYSLNVGEEILKNYIN